MSAFSETHSEDHSSLGDSAYEFIDTDTESRDGNATESVASDYTGNDDVASLADTERSEDSEDEHNRSMSPIPTYLGLDDDMSTPTIGMSKGDFLDDRPLISSIEFEEPFNLGAENVSVKHTICEFGEEETAVIALKMNLHRPPSRLVGTIRQTMTKQGLSTREPLRILYVGSHAAKQEIIHKVASSVAASVSDNTRKPSGGRNSQLFNVVPVSAFGSEKTPEIELMHSSGCQINVDDCASAINLKYEDAPGRPDVIKLSLDDSISYHSVWDEGGEFIIEPAWELPHVAIFYCAETDTLDAKRTRTFAKSFMNRHKVPSIVITHLQTSDKPMGCMTLDQHAIHMCLESRDLVSPRNIIHHRLPIDLASFLNIDARQMNRNLAYLTGLHEPLEGSGTIPKKVRFSCMDEEKAGSPLANSVGFVRSLSRAQILASLLPASMIVLSLFFSSFITNWSKSAASPSLIINGNTATTVPMVASTQPLMPISAPPSILSTSTSLRTSTKTITVTHSHSMRPNSLSVIPKMEVSKIVPQAQMPLASQSDEKTACSAEVLGDREILIRVPSSTLTSWLSKEAMSLNVSRGSAKVETERAYSTVDGIILKFPSHEAYGIMNISIIRTKKPKINETFEVDFGSSWTHGVKVSWGKLCDFASIKQGLLAKLGEAQSQKILSLTHETLASVDSVLNNTSQGFEYMQRQAARTRKQLLSSIDTVKLQIAQTKSAWLPKLESLKEKLESEREAVDVPKQIRDVVLRAQVESKLWWLKITGKDGEHAQYREAAHAHTIQALRADARIKGTEKNKRGCAARKKEAKAYKQAQKTAKKARACNAKYGRCE